MTLTGTEETVIADFLEAFGQDVLQETTDELLGGQGAGFPVAGGAVAVTKGDLTLLKFKDTPVGESDPKDIRGQILEGGLTGSHWLAMDDPRLSPDLGRNLLDQVCLLQGGPKLGPKETGQRLDVNEESVTSAEPGLPISR